MTATTTPQPTDVTVIPNGIDIDLIPKVGPSKILCDHDEQSRERKILLYIGRLDPYIKGLDLLLKGFSEAVQKKSEMVLALVGPDHKGGIGTIRKIITELNLENCTFILEPVYDLKKYLLLQEADLFVQPSRTEGMPVGVLEALPDTLVK